MVKKFNRKNMGVIYQRLINNIFADHIGTLIEVYIDDMLVKTTEDGKLLSDLEIFFGCLREHKMRLNLQKYAFAIEAEKFLGFTLTHRGIEANPDKCQANPDNTSFCFMWLLKTTQLWI